MPIPTSINDLSTTAGSNSPGGTEDLGTGDNYLRVYASYIAALRDVVLSGTGSLTTLNLAYTGTLTGSTGVMNIGSGQIYKDASGLVGIGVSPTVKLDVGSSGDPAATMLRMQSGGYATTVGHTVSASVIGNNSAARDIAFAPNGVERMRVDVSGNVGIGASAAAGNKLDVSGNISLTGSMIGYSLNTQSGAVAGATVPYFGVGVSSVHTGFSGGGLSLGGYYGILLHTGGGERMRIDSAGNVGINQADPASYGKFVVADTNGTLFFTAPTAGYGELCMAGGPGNFMRIGPANYADGGVMLMYTNSSGLRTTGAQLDRTGSVGIGRAPTVKLDVAGALALAAPRYLSGTTYTVALGDACLRIAANCTLLLPNADNFPGRMLRVLNVGAFSVTSTANNVVQLLTGTTGSAILPATAGAWADLHSDGVYWVVTASS